mgnify:CR=1 FL=1
MSTPKDASGGGSAFSNFLARSASTRKVGSDGALLPNTAADSLIGPAAGTAASACTDDSYHAAFDHPALALVDFPGRLWNRLPAVAEKSRDSKHTAKFMAEFFEQLAAIEERYARDLNKLSAMAPQNSTTAHEGGTLQSAWTLVLAHLMNTGQYHLFYSEFLKQQVVTKLVSIRKGLSASKKVLDERMAAVTSKAQTTTQEFAALNAKRDRLLSQQQQQGADPVR